MSSLIKHIRPLILTISIIIALTLYFIANTNNSYDLTNIRLTQYYAFAALIFLYITLLISPLYSLFPTLPYKPLLFKAKRALGVSAFFFGLLHGSLAFFVLLGGFNGLGFLSNTYIYSISIGFTALIILALLAATSFDKAVGKLGRRWKLIHQMIYIAGILIVIHALLIGSHYGNLSRFIPALSFALLSILLLLEAIRLDIYLMKKVETYPAFKLATVLTITILSVLAYNVFFLTNTSPLNMHKTHEEKVLNTTNDND